jgi:chorismate dehydratase
LGGVNITVTAQSETSIGLLAVVLTQFFGIEPPLEISQRPERSDADAFLLIGDDALRQRRMIADTGETVERSCRDWRVYDLGEIWFERTGLPFVFALWIARRDVTRETGPTRDLYERFLADMERVGKTIPVDFELLAAEAPLREHMEESEIISYWRQIDYGLTHENRKGLLLFKEFLDRIGYL